MWGVRRAAELATAYGGAYARSPGSNECRSRERNAAHDLGTVPMTRPEEPPPQLQAFIGWLKAVVHRHQGAMDKVSDQLGPGGSKQVREDLSCSYLPDWNYVVNTYLGPVQEITHAPLPVKDIHEGKWLHAAAARVTVPYTPTARAHESFSRVAAPVLAGFSLPAIVTLATVNVPGQPYRDIALGCFVGSTGLFLASFQLTIGTVYVRLYGDIWGFVRSGLTVLGIGALAAAVTAIVAGVAKSGWIDIALGVLCAGAVTQLIARPIIWVVDKTAHGAGNEPPVGPEEALGGSPGTDATIQ